MKQCFECEKSEDQIEIHDHHIVPKSKGGTKTIPLCMVCHGAVHGKNTMNIKTLTKSALQAKKKQGFRTGTIPYGCKCEPDGRLIPCPEAQRILAIVKSLRALGLSWRHIAVELNGKGLYNRKDRPWSKQNLRVCCLGRV